jgi:predicted nucleic acid-binding protein
MFLLDTVVVSNLRKPKPHPNLLEWFKTIDPDLVAISAITVFEVKIGILRIAAAGDEQVARDIQGWLDELLEVGRVQILPIDTDVALKYAEMFETSALKNFLFPDPNSKTPKSGADLIIASTAIVHGASVITVNAKHFLDIHRLFPLPGLYQPFSGEWLVGG